MSYYYIPDSLVRVKVLRMKNGCVYYVYQTDDYIPYEIVEMLPYGKFFSMYTERYYPVLQCAIKEISDFLIK